jgi:hypothetical protein
LSFIEADDRRLAPPSTLRKPSCCHCTAQQSFASFVVLSLTPRQERPSELEQRESSRGSRLLMAPTGAPLTACSESIRITRPSPATAPAPAPEDKEEEDEDKEEEDVDVDVDVDVNDDGEEDNNEGTSASAGVVRTEGGGGGRGGGDDDNDDEEEEEEEDGGGASSDGGAAAGDTSTTASGVAAGGSSLAASARSVDVDSDWVADVDEEWQADGVSSSSAASLLSSIASGSCVGGEDCVVAAERRICSATHFCRTVGVDGAVGTEAGLSVVLPSGVVVASP